ncbi:carbohydrate kinase family protein [Meiothermus sp. Pnk-1]|uniref:carbohydrate kinase family protein n=1 Tax=Meiothermus sp. Pnk-1 TaxID=873128 RepID=UPI000D7C912A|nr:carbohydrate kinase family protein [Meiothermus sp. Pnk-1]PZA07217.1 carbohydrate kinase family protein [Meiothermus sp. Pnk-1]RYM40077.1 carbohydrate kinase family protein [Meiothermus sp. PNK-Is4]
MGGLEAVSVGIVVADVVARPVQGSAGRGQLELVEEILLCSGGSAASTGYALARFGISSAVIGRVGQDGFGDFLANEAARHGAQSLLIRDPQAATSATQVLVDPEGERTFIHAIGANARLTPADVPLAELRARGAKLLHLAGFFALPGMDDPEGAPAARLLAQALELGFLTSLDNVWDATGRWERIHAVLPYSDFFFPSIHDARHITGKWEPKAVAEELFALGVRQVVALKMGPEGAWVISRRGERYRLGALAVPAVDGTGAGDAFIAGFLAGWLRGRGLCECGQLGSAAGAMCVRAVGAMPGITDWAELESMAQQVPVLSGGDL